MTKIVEDWRELVGLPALEKMPHNKKVKPAPSGSVTNRVWKVERLALLYLHDRWIMLKISSHGKMSTRGTKLNKLISRFE